MPPKRFIAAKATSPDVSPSSSPKRRRKSASVETTNDKDEVASPVTTTTTATNEKGPHPRDDIQPILLPTGKNYLKIINWNVNGFKSMATTNLSKFLNLVSNHNPDIICLQETKLQETLVDEYRDILPEYKSYWSCSTVKKGYSGTAVFLKKSTIGLPTSMTSASTSIPTESKAQASDKPVRKQAKLSSFFKKSDPIEEKKEETIPTPTDNLQSSSSSASPSILATVQKISYDFEDIEQKFVGEGRTITIEFDKFILVVCYVPNSGEGLVRLNYRVNEWDPHMYQYLQTLAKRKPVVYTGDLNVGHLDLDIHNPTAKHIVKQAGLTPQERNSMTSFLSSGTFKDAFRFFYPNAIGQFTYWSQRTFARPVNRGIRLDYFICSQDLFPSVVSSTNESTSSQEVQVAQTEAKEDGKEDGKDNSSSLRTNVVYKDTLSPSVYDTYILHEDTKGCSDHCPVALVLHV